MDVSAKLAALTSALGPYGHVRPGRAAETPGFAFYGAIGILVCDCIPGSCRGGSICTESSLVGSVFGPKLVSGSDDCVKTSESRHLKNEN